MKRGQLFEQPFVIIFSIIVIGLILIFGGYLIYKLVALGSDVDTVLLKNNINKKVTECKNLDYGSVCDLSKITFVDINVVCFIDTKTDISFNRVTSKFILKNLNLTYMDKKYNVYFEPAAKKRLKENYFAISALRPYENPLCVKVIGGKINLVLENKGEYVEIRK